MLDQQMSPFLGLENIDSISSSKKGMSVQDREALDKLNSSVRPIDGHYEVGMLWKHESLWLPNNRVTAVARPRSLKRRLGADEQLCCKYRNFMDDLLIKGYARKLTEDEAAARTPRTWYLPHHGVFHHHKPGKIRVVFHAAALHDGVSLNSQLNGGVLWNIEKDAFQFEVFKPDKPGTKQGILSVISSLYDPMGYVCPVVLEAKKIMQRLWKLQLGWDDPVPECKLAHWEWWKSELSALAQVQIPRCHFQLRGEVKEISLHQFSDTSDEGYGMCSYLLFVYEDSSIQCSFLMGKSKAMSVRPISIPRLELQAATLSAKIYQFCREELTYKIEKVVFWTDSQTTLQYIKNDKKRFNTYVANRIAEIREITSPDQWRHCPGKLNPADDASRGLKPQKLIDQYRWWRGPEYLWKSEDNWPEAEIGEVSQDDPEVQNEAQVHSIKIEKPEVDLDSELHVRTTGLFTR